MREWRKHWSAKKFLQALVFGLLFSVLDMETDFAFAWSVPDKCPQRGGRVEQDAFTDHCGHFVSKAVKYCTFSFIALPGAMLAFSAAQNLIFNLWERYSERYSGRKVPRCLQAVINGVMNAVALILQTSLCIGLTILPVFYDYFEVWSPELKRIYDFAIPVLAYSSATFIILVKLLAIVSHGPETTNLVKKATGAEVRYEAALQLILLGTRAG